MYTYPQMTAAVAPAHQESTDRESRDDGRRLLSYLKAQGLTDTGEFESLESYCRKLIHRSLESEYLERLANVMESLEKWKDETSVDIARLLTELMDTLVLRDGTLCSDRDEAIVRYWIGAASAYIDLLENVSLFTTHGEF